MAVKFGSILEPNNPNTTAIAKTVHLSGARSVPTYADLNNIIPTVLSPSFNPATGTIDTKDAIGQVWYVADENKYYRLSNIRITGDKPPFTPVTSWENFATSVVASQERWIHDYIASGVSTQSIIGYNPQSGSSTANNIYFTDANQIKFLTGGKYFKLDSSNGSDDVDNPALIVTESTLNSKVDTIYTADINPLWGSVEDIVKYINTDIAGYINDLYSKVGTVTANATWSGIIGDKTTQSGNLPKGTVKAIVGDTNDYVVQFGTNQVDLQNVIRDDNNNELSRANILVGKNAVTKKQQAIVYTTSRDVSANKIVSMDELTINPNSIYLGNQDTTTFTARDNLTITPGVISMYAGSNMNIQLGTKSENHNINIIPDSTNALYGATFTNLPLNVETLNFKNGTTLTSFNTAVNDIIDTKVYTRNINITNKSRILTTIDPGELVVYHATSSNGFIVRTKPATGNLYQLQLLSTNGRQSYQYNFPLTGGTVALESYVNTQITNLSTNFTNIVGNLQEQITDNYDELDGKITDVNARVDTTNATLKTTTTNLSNHEKKIATVSEYGHVMLGTKAVISNNFVCIGTHTNGGLVFAIDTALNATSSQPLKNSVITAELAKKATTDALTTGLATKVDKDMTSVTGREMVVQLANGTDIMSGLGIHDGNVMAIGNGIGDAVVANGLGVDVATGTSYLYSDNTEYNLTELVKTTIPGIQNTLATKADSTTLTTELAKKADKATTLAGYGITDAYTKTATDTALATKADKATTLAGYGITDALSKTVTTQQTVAGSVKVNNTFYATTIYENNTSLANKYAAKSHTHAISDVTNLQTTLDSKASTTDVETLTNNLATEVSDRETADTNLQTSITTNATNITTLQGKVSTLETNALSKTTTAQQSVASEVKFNGGIRADSIKTLYGTSLFTTVSAKGFDFTGIYRMFPYQSTEAFFESTVAGGSNTLLRATTIYENGVSLADTYAKKADVYTKTETDSAIVAVISNKNKSVWSPEFTTTDYDSTEEAYKWIIGVYTIPGYSNALPIVQIYEDSSATGTPTPAGATELELVQPKIAVTYDSTGTKAAVTAYFNFESADLPIVAYRYKAQIWFPGMRV